MVEHFPYLNRSAADDNKEADGSPQNARMSSLCTDVESFGSRHHFALRLVDETF
jgi:hypothetical protein